MGNARGEKGAIAIVMALTLTVLLVVAAMALDFGLVRVDREVDKSAADSATLAGLHALNAGDGLAHPYAGVCTAVRYLQRNGSRFATINEGTGWTDGLDAPTGNGCSSTSLQRVTCNPADKSTWAKFSWSGSWQGTALKVTIESGYDLSAHQWAEDSLAASSGDNGDANQHGCDQLAVTITQNRKPGLGSLVTSSDLVSSVRSVGRVRPVAGDSAPALLLLQRTGCPVAQTGSGGSTTFIHVFGTLTSHGTSQPGTIHSDSDGLNCTGGSNTSIFLGRQDSGIVAYAAPLVSNPTAPDPSKPGSITSVATANGISPTVVRDSVDNVYGSSAVSTAGTRSDVTGRNLIGRTLVDQRYRGAVSSAISGAAGVFASGAAAAPPGWTTLNGCAPTQAQVPVGLTASSRLYVNCTANGGFTGGGLTINAGTIFFNGVVNPSGTLDMPNASKIYVAGSVAKVDGLNIGNGASFAMNNATSNLTNGQCSSGQNSSKAELFVQYGDIRESNGGLLRLCRTTVFMMGGRPDGCVPTTDGTAPTSTPCAGGLGTGQLTQQGGDIDWSAPDTIDQALDSAQAPLPTALAAWADANGPEDLALWSESASQSNGVTYNMNGGGLFHVRGVFMVPNAAPFSLGGNGSLNLTSAQFIVSSLALNGTPQVTMAVNPDSAVALPDLGLVGLVR